MELGQTVTELLDEKKVMETVLRERDINMHSTLPEEFANKMQVCERSIKLNKYLIKYPLHITNIFRN